MFYGDQPFTGTVVESTSGRQKFSGEVDYFNG